MKSRENFILVRTAAGREYRCESVTVPTAAGVISSIILRQGR